MTADQISRLFVIFAVVLFVLSIVVIPLFRKRIPDTHQAAPLQESYCSDELGSERVCCIDSNEEALCVRLEMIKSAKERIDMATFDLRCDECGSQILAHLYEAAERGVAIRILIDGLCSRLVSNPAIQALQEHGMIDVRLYNPISLLRPWKINARMHDKIFIVDGSLYLIGGRNTSNKFLGAITKRSSIDRELLVHSPRDVIGGASGCQVEEYFNSLWERNDTAVIRMTDKAASGRDSLHAILEKRKGTVRTSNMLPQLLSNMMPARKVTLITNSSEARVKAPLIWHQIKHILRNAQDIVIKTPYMICNDMMYADLVQASRGARLRILTNSTKTNANIWGASDYLNSMGRIRRMGLNVFEHIDNNSNHTKTILVDGRLSIVGSYNLDMRSTYLDTESMIVVDSVELNQHLSRILEQEIEKSRALQEYTYFDLLWNARKGIPAIKRIALFLLRPLTPLVRQLL